MRHMDITGYNAPHQWCFVGDDDPADDPDNDVQVHAGWYAPTTGLLQIRNDANDGWVTLLGGEE